MSQVSVPAPVTAYRPGVRSLVTLIGCEVKMVLRDTAGLVVPLGLPLLILLTSAGSAGGQVVANGRTALEVFVLPLVLAMVVAMIGIINMPSFLAYYRRSGILRRLAVTPASPGMVLAAQVIASVLQALVGIALATGVAFLVFGVGAPADIGVTLGVFVLVMAAMYAAGMIVAAVAPTPNSAVAIGLVFFFLVGALGGMFGGPDALPAPLATIGGWLPFGAAVAAISAAWSGTAVGAAQLVGLGTTVVVGVLVAGLLFRWE
ncbi:ABC transporter permease [Micromonospora radicis]|uniref:ABC transporter permease n=1 Tax=Micromonospora radicis TaxID=1894971 RepID=A0A418MWR4_9ACTN|nr:ABC transporter permease [Micromonospora radicis]RIV39189.1 ABC transporter permease [Micromonospora radicis]